MIRAGYRPLSLFTHQLRRCHDGRKALSAYSDAAEHVSVLRALLGNDARVLTSDLEKYTQDWTGHYSGGSVVAFPSSVEEVSKVMKYCHENTVGVVMQGGNTGLVGGAVGIDKELIMSTARMNQIHHLDETSGVLICDAGVILEDANNFAKDRGFLMPIDLGSKASCMVGGNVSSNAGGLRVVKYGSLHANVVGLECVLADGTVLDMLRVVRKDNCGYHLKHLFIGSEGTLGVVTKVAIKLFPLPTHTVVTIVKVSSFEAVSELLRRARHALGETLSAFEYMDRQSIDALAHQYPHTVQKFSNSLFQSASDGEIGNDSYVLIEASSSNVSDTAQSDTSLSDRVNQFLSSELQASVVLDAVIAQDSQQETELWKIRELIPVALAKMSRNGSLSGPFLLKYDISIPWAETEVAVHAIREYLSQDCGHVLLDRDTLGVDSDGGRDYFHDHASVDYVLCVFCFGHAGDQNLHLNVILRLRDGLPESTHRHVKEAVKRDLEAAVLRETMQRNGSLSAEHGIGQQKSHLLSLARTPAEMAAMRLLKTSFDPKCILNPGKIIPLK
jgi:FAD/FMN-containing dehydrogenase